MKKNIILLAAILIALIQVGCGGDDSPTGSGQEPNPNTNPPEINSVEPDSGAIGTEVTIQGQNFSATASGNTITFNGIEAPVSEAAEDQLVTEVPEGATDGPVEVTVEGETATGPDFDVQESLPSIALSKDTTNFQTVEGGSDPVTDTVMVTNSGGGTLEGLDAKVTYGKGQPTGWLTALLGDASAPDTLTLSVTSDMLSAGSYDATVDVTSDEADNSPQVIKVTVDVKMQGDTATLRDVVINEVNWYGNGTDTSDEWIELRNISGGSIDLSGWIIDNGGAGSDPVVVDDGTILADGDYLVIGNLQGADVDGERTSLTGVANVQLNSVELGNGGEELILRDIDATVIDKTPVGAWPAGDESALESMQRLDNITGGGYDSGETAGSWYTWATGDPDNTSFSTADHGTPGADNSDPSP